MPPRSYSSQYGLLIRSCQYRGPTFDDPIADLTSRMGHLSVSEYIYDIGSVYIRKDGERRPLHRGDMLKPLYPNDLGPKIFKPELQIIDNVASYPAVKYWSARRVGGWPRSDDPLVILLQPIPDGHAYIASQEMTHEHVIENVVDALMSEYNIRKYIYIKSVDGEPIIKYGLRNINSNKYTFSVHYYRKYVTFNRQSITFDKLRLTNHISKDVNDIGRNKHLTYQVTGKTI